MNSCVVMEGGVQIYCSAASRLYLPSIIAWPFLSPLPLETDDVSHGGDEVASGDEEDQSTYDTSSSSAIKPFAESEALWLSTLDFEKESSKSSFGPNTTKATPKRPPSVVSAKILVFTASLIKQKRLISNSLMLLRPRPPRRAPRLTRSLQPNKPSLIGLNFWNLTPNATNPTRTRLGKNSSPFALRS